MRDALDKGAVAACGGARPDWGAGSPLAGGFFFEPTVLTGARCWRLVSACACFGVSHSVHHCWWRACTCACLLCLPGQAGPRPSILTPPATAGATPAMRVFREEVFGPVTPVFKFGSEGGEAAHWRTVACPWVV